MTLHPMTRLRDRLRLVSGDGGFTLVETMSVMVIIGLLATLILPQMAKYREKSHVVAMKVDARYIVIGIEAYSSLEDDNFNDRPPASKVEGGPGAQLEIGVRLSKNNSVTNYTASGLDFAFTVRSLNTSKTVKYVSTTDEIAVVE